MGRNAQPIELILAKGKSHMGKDEIRERKERELKVPFSDVKPPDYLGAKQKEKFNSIAEKLLALKVMTELDEDCLARYILAQELYVTYTSSLVKLIRADDLVMLKDIQTLQNVAFKQAQAAASKLGLTITDRAKLVVPQPQQEDEEL